MIVVCLQVIELSKQNTTLEEEALSLEQKLGEAEDKVEKGEKRLAELSAQLASGASGSKELREKLQEKEVRPSALGLNRERQWACNSPLDTHAVSLIIRWRVPH